MPHAGRITSSDTGHDGAWLVALRADGTPVPDFTLTPLETLPDVVPVWAIRLRAAITPVVWTNPAVLACVVASRPLPRRSAPRT